MIYCYRKDFQFSFVQVMIVMNNVECHKFKRYGKDKEPHFEIMMTTIPLVKYSGINAIITFFHNISIT